MGFPLFLVLTLLSGLPSEALAKEGQHAPHAVPTIPQELIERPITIQSGIGTVHDDAAAKLPEAQRFYDQGLAYLHNYVWIEAARSFHQALRADPNLALAHVGLSVAYVELNKPTQAREAIVKAQTLSASSAPSVSSAASTSALRATADKSAAHVRRHVDVRALQMAAEDSPRDAVKLAAYRKALDAAVAAFPSDPEFLVLRGIAESPDPADRGQGSVAASIPYYQRALKLAPTHFGAQHVMAHAYENTGQMKDAEVFAALYAAAAPKVPHAVHMHGHELRRLGRITEAIARFEAADKLERAYVAREKISADLDWHYAHNLDLLAASYQYAGQMKKAEALLKQSFGLQTSLLVQAVNKREWPAFLLARNRPAEALAAAQSLLSHSNLVVQATGHIESGFAYLAMNRPADAANASNAALRALRGAQAGQELAAIALEALQGEFLLRTGQRDKGRAVMESAARKWRSLPGPDAWTQSLFRLEALARSARAVGDWAFAARMAQLMLEHDANYAGTHLALALVADHDGNTAAAAREFAAAVKAWGTADPDLPELKIARRP